MRIFAGIAVALGIFVTLAIGIGIGAFSAQDSLMERPWQDRDLGPAIAEGAATDRFIWLLGWNGGLVRFDRETGERLVLGRQVHDILADGPHLWAVSVLPDGSRFEIRDLRDPTTPTIGDELPDHTPIVQLRLTQQRDLVGVIFLRDSESVAAASASGSVYVGADLGEFGGRLTRYGEDPDPHEITGLTAAQAAAGGCEGDFNPDCDPIVGVVTDPQHSDCVIAASGQFHLGMTHGKVYRVCGDQLTLIYRTPNRTPMLARVLAPTDYWRDLSAPIESLSRITDGWVAVSTGRYFRMQAGDVIEHPMPDLRPWSGLYVSEERDGLIFVLAHCCSGLAFDRQASAIAVPVLR